MGDIAWPKTLKPNVTRGYSFRTGSNILRQQPQGGKFRQSVRYSTEAVEFTVTIFTDQLGLQIFDDFFYNDLQGGANSFPMNLDSGGLIEQHQCSISSEVNRVLNQNVNWIISFSITAESTPAQAKPFGGSLSEIAREYDSVKEVGDTLNLLDELMNETLPSLEE